VPGQGRPAPGGFACSFLEPVLRRPPGCRSLGSASIGSTRARATQVGMPCGRPAWEHALRAAITVLHLDGGLPGFRRTLSDLQLATRGLWNRESATRATPILGSWFSRGSPGAQARGQTETALSEGITRRLAQPHDGQLGVSRFRVIRRRCLPRRVRGGRRPVGARV